MFLVQFIVAFSTQSASPPPPPNVIHDWAALSPMANSDRVSVVCRDGRRVTAEFNRQGNIVSVVDIKGYSRRLSKDDRAAINAAAAPLLFLDRVEIGCNVPHGAVISVLGGFEEVNGKLMQKLVRLVWGRSGLSGTEGRKVPKLELSSSPR